MLVAFVYSSRLTSRFCVLITTCWSNETLITLCFIVFVCRGLCILTRICHFLVFGTDPLFLQDQVSDRRTDRLAVCINLCIDRSSLRLSCCRYWRYNEEMRTMDPGYPKPITIWKGIPDSPQGAFVDKANGMPAVWTM